MKISSLFAKAVTSGGHLVLLPTIDTDSLIVLFPWFGSKNIFNVRTEQTVTTYSKSVIKDAIKFLFSLHYRRGRGGGGEEQRLLNEF